VTSEGIEFCNAKPEVVINHLRTIKRKQLEISPSDLHIKSQGKYLVLKTMGKQSKEYPVRRSFLYKLLKWYSFPVWQLGRLSGETIASLCNDYLLNIKRDYVTIKFEGDEALTIVSPSYNEITDLEIIERVKSWKVNTISRNDFMMRINTEEKYKFQAKVGDDCGLGLSIMNSETGFQALNIVFYILRYKCSNGAMIRIVSDKNSRMHYGHHSGVLQEFLDNQVKLALFRRKDTIESLKKLSEEKVAEAEAVVKKFLSVVRGKGIKIPDEMNQYDLFNLITSTAKQYDLNMRIYLEGLAGELVNIRKN
jgi:hypothetical protein